MVADQVCWRAGGQGSVSWCNHLPLFRNILHLTTLQTQSWRDCSDPVRFTTVFLKSLSYKQWKRYRRYSVLKTVNNCLFLCCINSERHFYIEKYQFLDRKTRIFSSICLRQEFKGCRCYSGILFLIGISLKIKSSVPLFNFTPFLRIPNVEYTTIKMCTDSRISSSTGFSPF